MVERLHRVVKECIQSLQPSLSFQRRLQQVLFDIRNSVHRMLGMSPNEAFLGRLVRTRLPHHAAPSIVNLSHQIRAKSDMAVSHDNRRSVRQLPVLRPGTAVVLQDGYIDATVPWKVVDQYGRQVGVTDGRRILLRNRAHVREYAAPTSQAALVPASLTGQVGSSSSSTATPASPAAATPCTPDPASDVDSQPLASEQPVASEDPSSQASNSSANDSAIQMSPLKQSPRPPIADSEARPGSVNCEGYVTGAAYRESQSCSWLRVICCGLQCSMLFSSSFFFFPLFSPYSDAMKFLVWHVCVCVCVGVYVWCLLLSAMW